MKASPAIVGALLLFAGSAALGALKAIEEAYELSLAQVVLPGDETGKVMIRRCPTCKAESLRVTADTRYFVRPSKTPVSLDDARKAAGKAAGRAHASAYVYYDPKTRTVRRLVLDTAQ